MLAWEVHTPVAAVEVVGGLLLLLQQQRSDVVAVEAQPMLQQLLAGEVEGHAVAHPAAVGPPGFVPVQAGLWGVGGAHHIPALIPAVILLILFVIICWAATGVWGAILPVMLALVGCYGVGILPVRCKFSALLRLEAAAAVILAYTDGLLWLLWGHAHPVLQPVCADAVRPALACWAAAVI